VNTQDLFQELHSLSRRNEKMIEDLKKISNKENCKFILHQVGMSSARINELIRSISMETEKVETLLTNFVKAI
jgi:hypothetical protein